MVTEELGAPKGAAAQAWWQHWRHDCTECYAWVTRPIDYAKPPALPACDAGRDLLAGITVEHGLGGRA